MISTRHWKYSKNRSQWTTAAFNSVGLTQEGAEQHTGAQQDNECVQILRSFLVGEAERRTLGVGGGGRWGKGGEISTRALLNIVGAGGAGGGTILRGRGRGVIGYSQNDFHMVQGPLVVSCTVVAWLPPPQHHPFNPGLPRRAEVKPRGQQSTTATTTACVYHTVGFGFSFSVTTWNYRWQRWFVKNV